MIIKLKKRLKKIFILLIVLGVLTAVLGIGGWFLEAKVKSEIRAALDDLFEPQIEQVDIRLSFLLKFPNPYLFLQDLKLTHQTDSLSTEVLEINHLGASLNFWKLLKGEYSVKEAKIHNGEVLFFANEKGDNIRLFKYKKRDLDAPKSQFELNIPKLILENISIVNHNDYKKADWHLSVQNGDFTGFFKEGKLYLNGSLSGVLDSMATNGNTFLKDQALKVETGFEFDTRQRKSSFQNGKVMLGNATFDLEGSLLGQYPNGSKLDIQIGSEDDFEALFSFLPEEIREQIKQVNYNAKSNLALRFMGLAGPRHNAKMEVDFVVENAQIVSSKYPVKLDSLNFNAKYSNGENTSPATSKLVVNDFKAYLNDRPILLDLELMNFDTPSIDLSFDINVDLKDLHSLFSIPAVKALGGQLTLAGNANGQIGKEAENVLKTNMDGSIFFEQDALLFDKSQFNFTNLSGSIYIKDSLLNFENLKGDFTNIPFRLSGKAENTYRLFVDNGKSLKFNLNAYSNSINLNEVFKEISAPTKSGKRKVHPLTVPKYMDGTLKLRGARLKYRGATAQRFNSQLRLKNGEIIIPKMSMDVLHGHLSLDARMKRKNRNYFDLSTNINLGNLNTKRLLEIFNDFEQNVLTSKQVEGRLSGNITLTALIDRNLHLPGDDIAYYGSYALNDAELIDFEPIVKALKSFKKKEASHVHIDNLNGKAVYHRHQLIIPELSFNSNISDISMFGIRSPNEEMDFYFELSLGQLLFKSKKRKQKEREGKKEKKDGIMDMRINLIGQPGDMKVKTRSKKVWEEKQRSVNRAYLAKKKQVF